MATNAGQAVPLNYGYNWITGIPLQKRTLVNTGNISLDYTRVGMWLLGEGEEDGLVELWDSSLGRLLARNESENPNWLHWHSGCDASGYESGTGPDQGEDSFWQYLPAGLTRLRYNRWAYYAIKLKQLINNPPNTNQDDESVWADVNPIGLWRGRRCRFFDSSGAMLGYAFTRNPAWHYVDLLCKRKLFPEFNIVNGVGPDDLPAAVRRRFDWSAISEAAAYYAQVQANGLPLFTGDYSFTQKTSLQACVTQILTCARSFERERSGTFAIVPDKPRASVFTFTRANAYSVTESGADVHSAANRNVSKYRDLMIPAFAAIAGISCPDHQKPVLSTMGPHSAVADDYIVIDGTGTAYDTSWQVDSVPGGDYAYQMTLKNRGSNYPESVGAGGSIGFRYSRFKERTPEFNHKAHQYARGGAGVGLPRQRNKVTVETDFANSTWDQVSRISKYQRAIALGPDVSPYVAPPRLTLRAPNFAADAAGSGAIALQVEPGDVVTIDSTLSDARAGMYEVMNQSIDLTGSAQGQGSQRTPSAGGVQFVLRPYSDDNYPSMTTPSEPGWPVLPTLPGNHLPATKVPLEDGELSVFAGTLGNEDSFELPEGYTTSYMLSWGSPQGFIEGDAQLHYISDCDVYAARKAVLYYHDGSNSWGGDLNVMAVASLSQNSATKFSIQGVNFLEVTLAGGEKVVFGKGIVASGTQVPLPPGYVAAQTIPLGFPKSAGDTGNNAHGVCAFINTAGVMQHDYKDGEGNVWQGPGQAFIFSFKNNGGTWRSHGNGWYHCPLPDGRALCVSGITIYTSTPPDVYGDTSLYTVVGSTFPGMSGMSSATLRTMPGPNGFDIIDHPAHGVKRCYVDQNTLEVACEFEDGEGNHWGGATGIFGLLCDTPTSALGGSVIDPTTATWPGTGSSGGSSGSGGSGGGGGGGGEEPPGNPRSPEQPWPVLPATG